MTEKDYVNIDSLDGEDSDIGVGMTPQSRAALMAKLAEGHNAGLSTLLSCVGFCNQMCLSLI